MEPTPITSGAWSARLLAGFAASGIDPDALCRAAHADRLLLADPDAAVPLHAYAAVWREAERSTADTGLGLHVGQAAPLDPYLISGYTLLASHSLADFARHHLELQRITYHADFLSLHEGRDVEMRFSEAPGYAPTRHAVEYTAVVLARFFRGYFGAVPIRVTFRHPAPANVREHAGILGAPVHFAAAGNSIALRRADFERQRQFFSEATFARLLRTAEGVLRDMDAREFREQVRAVLHRRMGKEPIAIDAVSRALHVSPRTLQRRLTAEGTSFNALLDAARHEVAIDHVRNGASVRQAARAVGFAEVASFTRAFRRWTGTTPTDFRERETPRRAEA